MQLAYLGTYKGYMACMISDLKRPERHGKFKIEGRSDIFNTLDELKMSIDDPEAWRNIKDSRITSLPESSLSKPNNGRHPSGDY